MSVVERFAPSPTGYLHLGHAYSAWMSFQAAQEASGRFLLRLEDLDAQRSDPHYEAAIFEDLAWLGLEWEEPVWRQSERTGVYNAALETLKTRGLVYPCVCSRKDIQAAVSAPHTLQGPDGATYPGTCRGKGMPEQGAAWRLDMRKAIAALGGAGVIKKLHFKELLQGPNGERKKISLAPDFLINTCGDVVLARKDALSAYHLAVVIDDAAQGITHITRGRDLFYATHIHRVLQALLGRPTPHYRHHDLIRDDRGKRLAKRDDAKAIRTLREAGLSAAEVFERITHFHTE